MVIDDEKYFVIQIEFWGQFIKISGHYQREAMLIGYSISYNKTA